ncbi:hypothetical protein THAOC_09642 [Thalassiosira oceanica]|uniref:Uncharacterized protein n=1 Tax=Thalassiosira oceanica TaxID=159749 RepID=K0T757_THAOC|nr:hypothetical protein THAOC_09642 [Thalassiosira oceanica]|eukprot:EJK69136.1 hypothetical protein THAOC_09642 [Thalassiosira oceanica]
MVVGCQAMPFHHSVAPLPGQVSSSGLRQQFSRDAEGRRLRRIVLCTAGAAGLYKSVGEGRRSGSDGGGRTGHSSANRLLPAGPLPVHTFSSATSSPVTSRPGQLTPPDDPNELPGPRMTLGQLCRGGAGRRSLLVVEGRGGHGSGPRCGEGATLTASRPGDPPFGIGGCVGGWDRGVLGRGMASATTGRPCTVEVADSEECRRARPSLRPVRGEDPEEASVRAARAEVRTRWTRRPLGVTGGWGMGDGDAQVTSAPMASEPSNGSNFRVLEGVRSHRHLIGLRAAGVVSRAERRQAGGGDVFGRCKGEPPRELVAERGRRSKDETILREISIRRRGTPRPGFASGDGRGSPRDREEGGVDQEDQNLFSTTEGVRFSSLRRLRRWVGQEMEGLRLDAPLADGGVLPAQACIPRTGSLSAG